MTVVITSAVTRHNKHLKSQHTRTLIVVNKIIIILNLENYFFVHKARPNIETISRNEIIKN